MKPTNKRVISPTTDFLTAAQDRLNVNGGTSADKAALASRKEARAEQYQRSQVEFFEEHIAPLLKQLTDLPEDKGRRFAVETRFSLMNPDAPALTVGLSYSGKPGGMKFLYDKAFMIMDDFVDDNRFMMRIVRYDRENPDNYKEHDTVRIYADVAQMQSEIGRFVADVAPDRVAELVARQQLAAKQKPAAPKA
ncbi:MAG: hypothetical protein PW788_00675 [Micavibrio sp.]|nr:hypothetical protein [Micavibrio sp.]